MTEEEKEIYRKFNDNLILCERFQDLKGFRISFQEALLLREIIEKLQEENEELRVQGSIVYLDYKILKDKIRKKLKAREEDRKDCDNSIIANNLLRDIYLLRELLEEE